MNKFTKKYNYYTQLRKIQETSQMNYYKSEYENFVLKCKETDQKGNKETDKNRTESNISTK